MYTNIKNIIDLVKDIDIQNMSQDQMLNIVTLSFVGIIIISNVITLGISLVRKGVRAMLSILVIVLTFLLAPKVSTFIVNKVGDYGILQKGISYVIEQDVEEKVIRDYLVETGENLAENKALLEELKTKAYSFDPNVSDEINIIKNVGFPQAVTNAIVLNMKDTGDATIHANNFYDYVARFIVSRLIIFFSYVGVFMLANKCLLDKYDQRVKSYYLQ